MTNQELDIKIAEAYQRVCDSIDENVTMCKQAMHFNWHRIMPIDTTDYGYKKSEPTTIIGMVFYDKNGEPFAVKCKEPIVL